LRIASGCHDFWKIYASKNIRKGFAESGPGIAVFTTSKIHGQNAGNIRFLARMVNQATPIFDAATHKPDPYTAVILYFPDSTRKGGIWTGRVWWSEGQAVEPSHWQRMLGPPHETDE
jgi:hypothetical protein